MYFIPLNNEFCDFYALNKIKLRLCIGLTPSTDLDRTIFWSFYILNKHFNPKEIFNKMSKKNLKTFFSVQILKSLFSIQINKSFSFITWLLYPTILTCIIRSS